MRDVLSELRSSLEKRLRELEPFITEHAQVRKALDALEGVGKRAEGVAASAAKRARTAKATAPARRRGRPRGSGATSRLPRNVPQADITRSADSAWDRSGPPVIV